MEATELRNQLTSGDPASRQQAAEWLSQNSEAAVAFAVELVQHAGDADRTVAEYCVATLEELGPPAPDDLPRLAAELSHADADVAYWAATLIGRCEQLAAPQAPPLADVVADATAAPQVRERAAWAIAKIGPAAANVRPQLETATNAEPSSLARMVAKALAAIEN